MALLPVVEFSLNVPVNTISHLLKLEYSASQGSVSKANFRARHGLLRRKPVRNGQAREERLCAAAG